MSAGNSAYSPLPQSNSDSDGSSEEELHVSRGNRVIKRAAKVSNSTAEKGHNEPKNNILNYKPLDSNSDVGIALNKFQSGPDEVSILKPDGNLEIFSTSRKIWFALSLLLCIFTTVAFIWLLPCNVDTCPSASDFKNYNFTWEENLSNLEIYGPISLISDGERNQKLIFLMKNHSENGLMCLRGRDGSLQWKIKLDEEPSDIDCKLIDINADGVSDCLVHGRNLLRAVNPVSGETLWDLQKINKNEGKVYFEEFPLVIPDLNKDGVRELLLSCSFVIREVGISVQNHLVIVSGKTGEIINTPLQIEMCSAVKELTFENDSSLSFTCFNSVGKESFEKISPRKLYQTVKSVSEEKLNAYKWETISQHVRDSAIAHVNGFRLSLENQGNCPEKCVVLVEVKDERDNINNKSSLHFSGKNTFGMAPVVLKTKKEIGFLLKFWKWRSEAEKSDFQTDSEFSVQKNVVIKDGTRNLIKRSKKFNHSLNNSKILDNELLSQGARESQRFKRTAARHRPVRSGAAAFNSRPLNLRVVTESIVKIVLNNSHLHINNISKNEIIQICRKAGVCQPNPYRQRQSVFVADFGKDEGEKLVTFFSSYVHDNKKSNKNSEDWSLRSRIRVLNL